MKQVIVMTALFEHPTIAYKRVAGHVAIVSDQEESREELSQFIAAESYEDWTVATGSILFTIVDEKTIRRIVEMANEGAS